ncbi:MAG TPA: hypothetical protein VEC12_10120 [Bacteroidia bacterium]|nr:hypothetical protein [Bacteroidia bacterium]
MLRNFIVVFLLLVACFVSSAQIKVIEGAENKTDAEKAHFDLLLEKDGKLVVLNTREDQKGNAEYVLQVYDRNKQYIVVNELILELNIEEEVKDGSFKIEHVQSIDKTVYLFVSVENKKETQKFYYAAAINSALETVISWKELYTIDLPETDNNNPFSSLIEELFIRYWQQDSIFMCREPQVMYGAGNNIRKKDYIDLELDFIDYEYVKVRDKIKPKIEENPNYLIADCFSPQSNKKLHVYLTSEDKVYNEKPSRQSLYFALYNSSYLIKHDDGKLIDFPENYYCGEIDCLYDSADNSIVVAAFYFDHRKKGKNPHGIFFLKYDVTSSVVSQHEFTPFTESMKNSFDDSESLKDNKEMFGIKIPGVKIIKTSNKYLVYSNRRNISTTTQTGLEKEKHSATALFGDIFMFVADATGKLTLQSYVPVKSEHKVDLKIYIHFSDILNFEKGNNVYWIFPDNIKNYTNGAYNGKTKEDDGKENSCLALLTITDDKTERTVLTTHKDLGVNLFQTSVLKIKDNEYVMMGFKDGTAKVITLTLE